jgi:hypothetical protein
MNEATEDKAWVTVETGLYADELLVFVRRPDWLYRMNPLIEWSICELDGDILRLAQEGRGAEARIEELPNGILLYWAGDDLKAATSITVEAGILRIEDDYSRFPLEIREARIAEVDQTLPAWGGGIYEFFKNWRRYSWLLLWRWYALGPWLKMKPQARRIVRLLILITLAEFLAFLVILVVLVIERG